jgi:hypothetical protein
MDKLGEIRKAVHPSTLSGCYLLYESDRALTLQIRERMHSGSPRPKNPVSQFYPPPASFISAGQTFV